MDWINITSTVLTTFATISIAIFTYKLWQVGNNQAKIQDKQNEIWYKTNYPDIIISDFEETNKIISGHIVTIFNKSEFGFLLKRISVVETQFKIGNELSFSKCADLFYNLYSKDSYDEEVHCTNGKYENTFKVKEDRKVIYLKYETPQSKLTLNFLFFIPILNRHLEVQVEIKGQSGVFDYNLKYKEAS